MRRFLILCTAVAAAFLPASSQNPAASDSQTLRDILTEIRHLRQDLHTTTVAAQRVQIALYRLQLQDAAVAKAGRTADDAHSKLNETTNERKRIAAVVDQWQTALDNAATPENERREIQAQLPSMKTRIEQLTRDEAQWQARAADADTQLAQEKNKLEGLHNVLNELDQALQNVGRAVSNNAKQ